ncbi:hypothetical protein BGZ65_003413 [Modicella reniformis]|uniref:DUF6589 domain-containing protein n=1 Tax=Modicella reniformis TaxID=1440133 RepID=A0A9P6IKY9_9FUNG|nr:hypothetical protein BGZ65_003413 [Modicella reniformis]
MNVARDEMKKDLDRLSEVDELRVPATNMSEEKVNDFSIDFITEQMKSKTPSLQWTLQHLATANENTDRNANAIVATLGSILLFLRSRNSNYLQTMMGLFLYANGTQHKVVEVLSHAGMSVSPSSIARMLEALSDDAKKRVRKRVHEAPWLIVYDNINLAKRKFDQRLMNADTFENGATATIIINERLSCLDQLTHSYDQVRLKDFIPDSANEEHFKSVCQYHLVNILRRHEPHKMCSNDNPEKHVLPTVKTETHPLPAMHIDQSSLDGNLNILYHIIKHQLDLKPEWFENGKRVAIGGDQLTVSRVRSLKELRADDISAFERMEWAVPLIQLFHLQMAFANTILCTHLGDGAIPGSLAHTISMLQRKRLQVDKANFHDTDDLLRHTFDAMAIRVWQVELKTDNLEAAVKDLDSERIDLFVSEHVENIYRRCFIDALSDDISDEISNGESDSELEEATDNDSDEDVDVQEGQRDRQAQNEQSNDRISIATKNAMLFIRDMILYLELSAAIKVGDIGRIEEVLKRITIMFQAASRKNYANELLRIHSDLHFACTPELKEAIMSAWLINTSGEPNGWKALDLSQEHNNKRIKDFNAAKGANASWTTLERSASANINVLADVSSRMESEYKIPNNHNWHSAVSADEDIRAILTSLKECHILSLDPLPEGLPVPKPVKDLFDEGLMKMMKHGVQVFIQKQELSGIEHSTNDLDLDLEPALDLDLEDSSNLKAMKTF